MKMVKSLLLGSAAGLVAVAGAQAADLPVKAKAVEYVKICSLYGKGFYYIPGSDMCVNLGGWVRFESGYGSNGNLAWGQFAGNAQTRATNNLVGRARGYITLDARNQSAIGTVRNFIAVGLSENDVGLNTAANTFSANRAFIQFAGFTFGRAQSYFDFYNVPATSFWGSFPSSDTGDPGWLVAAYTAQFGGGFSMSLAAEERRITQILRNQVTATAPAATGADGNVAPGAFTNATTSTNTAAAVFPGAGAYGGNQLPDLVANLRLDQNWGGFQVMGALHQVNAGYYSTPAASGHPSDVWGYAVGVGLRLNAPMFGAGDYLQMQYNYSVGASRYVMFTPNTNWGKNNGSVGAFGVLSDGIYGGTTIGTTTTNIEMTTSWGVNAAYEHNWNPNVKTSLYGGAAGVSYNTLANAMLCGLEVAGAGVGSTATATAGCANNWKTWWLGSRTQWSPAKNLYMGVDVLYSKLYTASLPGGLVTTAVFGTSGNVATLGDQDNWQVRFRVHRDVQP